MDLGVGGVSYVELLILYELRAGERLSLEKAHPRYLRPGRPISVCLFACCLGWVGSYFVLLVLITGGFVILVRRSVVMVLLLDLVRVPLSFSLNELLGLFRYPPGSGRALLAGTLPLRYCAARFACRSPTWRLPDSGHFAGLVTADVGVAGEAVVGCAAHEVSWVSGSGSGRRRI